MSEFFFIAIAVCAFVNIIGVCVSLNKHTGSQRDYGIRSNGMIFIMNSVFLFWIGGWIAIPTLIVVVVMALMIQYYYLGGKEKAAQDKDEE